MDVRAVAVSQLGFTRRADAIPPLSALADDPLPQIRVHVAHALGQIGSQDATPPLLRLRADADPHVRSRATHALGTIGGPTAVDALRAMAEDPDPTVRTDAAQALPQADGDTHAQFTALATDPVPEVRAALLSGLAAAGTAGGFDDLLSALADDPSPHVRRRVAATIRRLAPARAPAVLRRYLNEPALRTIAERELNRLIS